MTSAYSRCLAELKALAETTIRECTFPKTTHYFGKEEGNVLLPSGDEKYISFWVRDAAMMAESGLVPNEDLKRYIEIIATCGQNGYTTRIPFIASKEIKEQAKGVFF